MSHDVWCAPVVVVPRYPPARRAQLEAIPEDPPWLRRRPGLPWWALLVLSLLVVVLATTSHAGVRWYIGILLGIGVVCCGMWHKACQEVKYCPECLTALPRGTHRCACGVRA